MATLNPLGLLILYIALAGAPQSADQLTIRLGNSVEMRLEERDGGWWVRNDNSGLSAAYKREGMKLVARQGEDQQEIDLSKHFKLTGKEDYLKSIVIHPQHGSGWDTVEITAGKDRILVKTGFNEKRQESSVQWNKRN